MDNAMSMLDGNTAALNDYEAKEAEAARVWAAIEPTARDDVRLNWFKKLSRDDVIEALWTLTVDEEREFLRVCGLGYSVDAGHLLTTALNRAADAYLDTKRGQEAIAERVYQIDQDERDA